MTSQLLGIRVLAVEDEPMLLLALEDMLAELGCTIVATATNLSEALEAASRNDCDVAVLDVMLGTQPIDSVARILLERRQPIVFATGHDRSEIVGRFGDGSTVIEKPYSLSVLGDGLQRALGAPAA